MTSYTSAQSGDWNDPATWGGSGYPQNGDSATIQSGHTITLNVDQSSYSTGLTGLTINGTLKFKEDTVTALKMANNTNITIGAAGVLNIGTKDAPIQRPASGTESNAQLILQGSGQISPSTGATITMVGWTPTTNHTTLSSSASAGATQITTTDALGVQSGDKIIVGAGSVNGLLTESNNGVYTVSSVSGDGKTITITPSLGHSRVAGDYVAWLSRPIKITAGTATTLIPTGYTLNLLFKGVYVPISPLAPGTTSYQLQEPLYDYCTFHNSSGGLINFGSHGYIFTCSNSTFSRVYIRRGEHMLFDSCIFIQGHGTYGGIRSTAQTSIKNTIFQNLIAIYYYITDVGWGGILKMDNCSYKNLQYSPFYYPISLNIRNMTFDSAPMNRVFQPCVFYNCVIPSFVSDVTGWSRTVAVESYNHNQVDGAYRLWTRAGTVQSVTNVTPPNKTKSYQYTLNSLFSPVYRTIRLGKLEPGKKIEVKVYLMRDDAYSSVRAYIFDTTADPLDPLFGDNYILDSESYPDPSTSIWKMVRLEYKNNTNRVIPVAARVEAKSTSGSGRIIYEYVESTKSKPSTTIIN